MNLNKNFTVSVLMSTYNHSEFIEDAINSVLMQNCDFNVELIIADDCSTDNTKEIVSNLINKHHNGNWIKYTRHSINKGAYSNALWILSQANSKYVALCEGDDYWIDQNKLKKQVDFLENNKEFVLCYHNTSILSNGNIEEDYLKQKNIPQISSYYHLLCYGNFMQTSSVVFFNKIKSFPFEKSIQLNDYILWFWLSRFGKIYRINENMSIYRFGPGIWSSLSKENKLLHTLNALIEAKKIVKNENDNIVIDNRISTITLSLLPPDLQKLNKHNYNLKEYLNRNINIETLIFSIFHKIVRNIFRFK
jgi:glycosyltransferase involved in cell wall biosynthesis